MLMAINDCIGSNKKMQLVRTHIEPRSVNLETWSIKRCESQAINVERKSFGERMYVDIDVV
jgi:hypothetical protein